MKHSKMGNHFNSPHLLISKKCLTHVNRYNNSCFITKKTKNGTHTDTLLGNKDLDRKEEIEILVSSTKYSTAD
jgi:hypothetical protein